MSLDEVNERFPITKYKSWVSTRAEEGLPTAGGVAAPSSRPASIKDHEPSSEERGVSSSDSQRPATATSSKPKEEEKAAHAEGNAASGGFLNTINTQPVQLPQADNTSIADDIDEEDPIHAAVPAEMLATPGDSCAICIDTLEDDDDVRGLTCGHAFHASCVDPWLTSRRACCPLCKADYYIPKPRPEGEQNQEADRPVGRRSTNNRMDLQGAPALIILTGRRDGRSRSNRHGGRHNRRSPPVDLTAPRNTSRFLRMPRFQRSQAQTQAPDQPAPEVVDPEQHWTSRFRPSISRPQLSFWRRNHQNNADNADGTNAETNPTPGQLEAGSR